MCIRCGPENWVKRFHKVEDLLDAFRGYNCQGNTQERQESLLCPLMPNKKYTSINRILEHTKVKSGEMMASEFIWNV